MPDARLERARATLPKGYQFGDAGWRRPSENAAEQLQRRARADGRAGWCPQCGYFFCAGHICGITVNVIEGDHHG